MQKKQKASNKTIKKREWLYYGAILVFLVLLNIASWCSTAFCDWYRLKIFPIWLVTYGRITGIAPFSIGEILLGIAVLMVCIAIILILPAIKKPKLRKYYNFFISVTLVVATLMTLNCTVLYHSSTFPELYLENSNYNNNVSDLYNIYNHVAKKCNRLSLEVCRNNKGEIVYQGEEDKETAQKLMQTQAIREMEKMGEIYPELRGYYPRPKQMFFSDFMCQQNMCGWYFPFSLEANYNDVMYVMNVPDTLCHELAHLKGFMYEEEASFISYLACINSADIYFEYSGYLYVLGYLQNDLIKEMKANPEVVAELMKNTPMTMLREQVIEDDIFVTDEEWERINGKAIVSTEVATEVTDKLADTSMKLNGVRDGRVSYSRVVDLLLLYYSQNEFEE